MTTLTKTNSKSIISIIFGILAMIIPGIGGAFGIIGIFISLAAKKEIEKTNEGGKAFATAGLICSIIGIVIQFFMMILAVIGVLSFYNAPSM
ncbi:MAG: DUF4190 domain-containing protein [Bacillaceae bacterium]